MSMMQKGTAIFSAALMVTALCACGGRSARPESTAAESAARSVSTTATATPEAAATAAPVPESLPAATAAPEVAAPTEEPAATAAPDAEPADGLRPDFKEAMDSYEAFYDEYCDFLQKYNANPTDLTLLGEYGSMLMKMEEMNKKFEAWESDDLNNAEAKYYIEVNSRITQKLIDVAQ